LGQLATQLPPPILEVAAGRFVLLVAFPLHKIAKLHGERRERWRLMAETSPIGQAQLLGKHADRPAVGNDVVHSEKRNMLLIIFPVQSDAEDRAFVKDIRALGFLFEELHDRRVLLPLGHRGDIDEVGIPVLPVADDRNRHAVAFNKTGAQGLVSLEDDSEGFFQGRGDQRTMKAYGDGDVVDRIARIELVEEPQALLGTGEWMLGGRGVCGLPVDPHLTALFDGDKRQMLYGGVGVLDSSLQEADILRLHCRHRLFIVNIGIEFKIATVPISVRPDLNGQIRACDPRI
jgi:hypothetical protein